VRASSSSLHDFELANIFAPAKDTNNESLTYIMPLRAVRTARAAANDALAKGTFTGTLDEFKLSTWTVSCLLSDLWYVNHDSAAQKIARGGGKKVA